MVADAARIVRPGYGALGIQLGGPYLSQAGQRLRLHYRCPRSTCPTSISPTSSPRPSPTCRQQPGQPGLHRHRPVRRAGHAPCRTPLIAAGIANGGVVMTPHVMAQVRRTRTATLVSDLQAHADAPRLDARPSRRPGGRLMQGVADDPLGRTAAGSSPSLARRSQDGYGPDQAPTAAPTRPTTG